jgi:hypothetical protein
MDYKGQGLVCHGVEASPFRDSISNIGYNKVSSFFIGGKRVVGWRRPQDGTEVNRKVVLHQQISDATFQFRIAQPDIAFHSDVSSLFED